jgi:rhamnose transport system ATP-binding protein
VRIPALSPDLLEADRITKSYAGVRALKGVSFALRAGEVHALIGENGAGKSTLIRIITGAVAADAGTLRVRGHLLAHNSPNVSRSVGIAPIYQQPALFPHLTVAENVALALESGSIWRRIDWRQRSRHAAELIERAGASIDPDRLASTLSMPEQQIVEIAKALGARAQIIIMDEPTSSLTSREVDSLFQVIHSLRAQGTGIAYISHRLEEVLALADRITVLRDGETIGTRLRNETDRAELIRMMVGRDLAAVFPERAGAIGETLLEISHLSNPDAGLCDITLSLRSGEILGLAGLVGSGRTQLAETIFGLTPAVSGEIRIRGKPVQIGSPSEAIRLGIAYVPEDRPRHGVMLEFPLTANTSLAKLGSVSARGLIRNSAEQELAQRYVARLGIKTPSIYTQTRALSGGNQQKVALARWLATEPGVLILDEPTQGVDVGSKAEIHKLMCGLAEHGLAILLISSDLPEILGMSDRIAVMRAGRISGVVSREEATQDKILTLALEHAASC